MWHNKKIRPLTRVEQWVPHYGLTGNTHNTFKGLFPFNFTSRITTTAALFLCRTVCYLYQLTEPLHKLNPNIYKLQCVFFFFFFHSHTICLLSLGRGQPPDHTAEERAGNFSARKCDNKKEMKKTPVTWSATFSKQASSQMYWLIMGQTYHRHFRWID